MFLAYLTLFTALTISAVAIYYSVSGLAAIFSAAVIPIIVMGGVLEVSKLVTAVWLHKYWRIAAWWLKIYLSIAVVVLMLITSIGIFGFLSKAHDTVSGNATEAVATVQRIDGQIAREENRITILQERIGDVSSGGGFDVSSSIDQQQEIITGARGAVQADIDYNQNNITTINEGLRTDLEALETSRTADVKVQTDKLVPLDNIVATKANQGTTTNQLEAGGLFRSATVETIDNVAEANKIRLAQKTERDAISTEIKRIDKVARDREAVLRLGASSSIREAQGNINNYRGQTQTTVDNATTEINRLREQSNSSQDDDLAQVDKWNVQIDGIYTTIDTLKDEKFESEQAVRLVESEVGPIRYIAEFFTGTENADATLLETAVSWLIMIIIFVFDPLAVLLLIASQYTFEHRKRKTIPSEEPDLKKPDEEQYPEPPVDMPPSGFDPQPFDDDEPHELNFEKLEPSIADARFALSEWHRQQRMGNREFLVTQDEAVEEPVEEELTITEPLSIMESGVTYQKIENSDYIIDLEGKSIHENALKSTHPELFLQKDEGSRAAHTSFGTAFPRIAVKGDIFVRVDQMPNRVYKFEGKHWIEINKNQSDSYLFDDAYIRHLVDQIQSGEYDVDLLSESERQQIELYLTDIPE